MKHSYGNGDTEDDNVIVDNREIMLICCLVIEPRISWILEQKESASDNRDGTEEERNEGKKIESNNRKRRNDENHLQRK